MMRIWKYQLHDCGDQILDIPAGGRVLHVGLDPSHAICLWALVDERQQPEKRGVAIYGTGHECMACCGWQYVGTVTMLHSFVWHVFVEPSPAAKEAASHA